jgi:cytochrome c5
MKPTLSALLLSLSLTACAASTPDTVATSAAATPAAQSAVAQAPAPAPAPSAAAAPADLEAGKKAFEQGCFSCHDQATILAQGGRTKADWADVVTMMQDRGFSGSPEDVELIVNYLAATHPPQS